MATIEKGITLLKISDNDGVPEIFLYEPIGKYYTEDRETDITASSFQEALQEAGKSSERINIRLNCPGGSMFHGNAMVTQIQESKKNIHVYNDGAAFSMAAIIWACVPPDNRHMAKNALLMLHQPSSFAYGNIEDIKNELEALEKFQETSLVILAEHNEKMTQEEIKKEYFDDGKDHYLTQSEVIEAGFLLSADDYEGAAAPDPAMVQTKSFHEVFNSFQRPASKPSPNLIQQLADKLKAMFLKDQEDILNQNQKTKNRQSKMKKEELIKALKEGTLTKDDIENIVAEHTPADDPAPDPEKDDKPEDKGPDMKAFETVLAAQLKPLQEKIDNQAQEIAALKAGPGEEPESGTDPEGDQDPPNDEDQEDEMNFNNPDTPWEQKAKELGIE